MSIDSKTGYYILPCSIKGVIFDSHRHILLGSNPRGEWELLGGRPDAEERDPTVTLAREINEEAGINVVLHELIDVWVYDVPGEGAVLIVTYLCTMADDHHFVPGDEHGELRLFEVDALAGLTMPDGYKRSIQKAMERLGRIDRSRREASQGAPHHHQG